MVFNKSKLIFIFSTVLLFTTSGVFCQLLGKKLKETLFQRQTYDSTVRPTTASNTVRVKIGLAMRQVIDLDSKNQILKSMLWFRWEWKDERLTWNSSEYDGIKVYRFNAADIWKPDIVIYNDIREEVRPISEYSVSVTSNGVANWNFPVLMKSECKVNVQFFPFDQQICPLKFGSWSYDGNRVDVTNSTIKGDNSTFMKNGQFNLIDFPVRRHVTYYSCCPQPYPDVTFYVIIRRKPLFVISCLILPCVVVAAVTLTGFYLPPDSSEKITLGTSTLLMLFVFLLLVSEAMPPQSDTVPLIGQFFLGTIFLLTMSLGCTILVINMYYRGQHGNKMPKLLKKVTFGCVARVLCMRQLVESLENDNNEPSVSSSPKRLIIDLEQERVQPQMSLPSVEDVTKNSNQKAKELRQLRDSIEKIAAQISVFEKLYLQREDLDLIESEWKVAAVIIDRLSLVLLTIATIILCCGFLIVFPDYKITESSLKI